MTVEPEPLAEGHGTCVLVVEDNSTSAPSPTQALRELGYSTVWVTDATKALAEIERVPFRFEVVFSDVVMPGMNGVELAGEIRRRRPDLPVVLTSGYSDVLASEGTHGFDAAAQALLGRRPVPHPPPRRPEGAPGTRPARRIATSAPGRP